MTDNPGPERPLRIGDTERERAVTELGEHFAAGRLTEDEHAERTSQAYEARTQADLDALFDDLPRQGGRQEEQQHGAGQWGPPPWAGKGPPPWAAAAGRGRGLRWLAVPFLVLALLGIPCAITHGFFPFFVIPLLVLAGTFLVLGKKRGFGGRPPWQRRGA